MVGTGTQATNGSPKQAMVRNERMIPRPMQELFDAVHHGKHSFDEFLRLEIESNVSRVAWSGRTIYKPSNKLKVFHKFLTSFLFEHLPTNQSVSFAYRKGTNPHQALLPHAHGRAFYQADIEKFFGSVTSELIAKTIESGETPVADIERYMERVLQLTTVEGRLAIGFSSSPAISNACMKPFDDALEEYCAESGLVYTRYADDIIISSQDRGELQGIDDLVAELLSKTLGHEFKLNPTKSKLTTIGRKVGALGMVILPSGRVTIDSDVKKKIEYQLHFFVRDKARFLNLFEHDLDAGILQLGGYISHVNAADPQYLSKLRRKFGAAVIDSFLHRSAK